MKRIHTNVIFDLPIKKHSSTEVKNHVGNKQKFVHLIVKSVFLIVFIGLIIYGLSYTWSASAGKSQPVVFTELYFEDYLHLPSQVIVDHPYFFQFTLHNLENKDMEYSYEVYVEIGQNRLSLDKGEVFVKENDYKSIKERFATSSVLPKGKIVVNLINKNQQIDFWIEGSS